MKINEHIRLSKFILMKVQLQSNSVKYGAHHQMLYKDV